MISNHEKRVIHEFGVNSQPLHILPRHVLSVPDNHDGAATAHKLNNVTNCNL